MLRVSADTELDQLRHQWTWSSQEPVHRLRSLDTRVEPERSRSVALLYAASRLSITFTCTHFTRTAIKQLGIYSQPIATSATVSLRVKNGKFVFLDLLCLESNTMCVSASLQKRLLIVGIKCK